MLLKKMKKTFLIVSTLIVMCVVPQSVSAYGGGVVSTDAQFMRSINNRNKPGDTGMVFQDNPNLIIWDEQNTFMSTAAIIDKAFQFGGVSGNSFSDGVYEYATNMSLAGNTNGVAGSVYSILFLGGYANQTAPGTPFAYASINGSSSGFFIVTQQQAMIASLSLVQNRPISYTTGTFYVVVPNGLPYAVNEIATSVKLN